MIITTIDLTKTHDFHGKPILASSLQQSILALRQAVANRSNTNFATYKIFFWAGTPIFNESKFHTKVTLQDDYFTVSINAKILYPTFVGPIQNNICRIIHTSKGVNTNIDFTPNYNNFYGVVEAIGILVAEQIRFNTLDLAVFEGKTFENSKLLFEYMAGEYLDKVYRKWRALT